jgi:CheY-like chemotaxis protein
VRPNHFEVAHLFGALRGMLRPLLAHNSSVNLVIEEPTGIPTLNTDEGKVSQILRNFISNALKYTAQGEVRLAARMEDPANITFTVTDTGIGISPEDQPRIFTEFVQVEGPHQKGKKGTGLGLSLSKKLAELLGGSISVQSEPGQGSAFSFSVPIDYTGLGEAVFLPPLRQDLDPTRLPLLVVEDNRETLFVYEKYLRGTGFQVIPAHSIHEARRALKEFKPVAILMDVLLQNEHTWEFMAEIKSDPATQTVPVYVITVVDNQQKALSSGADGFHAKPLDRQWLLEKLKSLVGTIGPAEILIIDDDEISRYVLSGFLTDSRYRIVEAASGAEGLRLAETHPPSVVFLDLMMPEVSGLDVLERLKSQPKTKDIPVIIHTAKLLSDDERERLSAHIVALVPKVHSDREASRAAIHAALAKAGLQTSQHPGQLEHPVKA